MAESEGILTADDTIADTEICEPCGSKYNIDRNDLKKIKGVSRKGFTLPETKAPKAAHRRYELKFPQADFINLCNEDDKNSLLNVLKAESGKDTQKVNVLDITSLGLVEMTRKKELPPLYEQLK